MEGDLGWKHEGLRWPSWGRNGDREQGKREKAIMG